MLLTLAALRERPAACPFALELREEFGRDRDGESIALGPAGRSRGTPSRRVWTDGAARRVAWQFRGARPGHGSEIAPRRRSWWQRWLHRRREGPTVHADCDAQLGRRDADRVRPAGRARAAVARRGATR